MFLVLPVQTTRSADDSRRRVYYPRLGFMYVRFIAYLL